MTVNELRDKRRDVEFKMCMMTFAMHYYNELAEKTKENGDKAKLNALMVAVSLLKDLAQNYSHELRNIQTAIELTEAAYGGTKN